MAYHYPPQEPNNFGPPPTGTPYPPSAGIPFPSPTGMPHQSQAYIQPPNQLGRPVGFAQPPAPKKKRKWPWIIPAVFLLLVVITIATSGTQSPRTPAQGTVTADIAPADPASLA